MYKEALHQAGILRSLEDLMLAFHLTDKLYMRERPGALGKKNAEVMQSYYNDLHRILDLPPINAHAISEMMNQMVRPNWHPFAATLPTLTKLKEEGIGVGLISNWDHTAREVMINTGIYPLLDEVIISAEVGFEKPDERIFQHALARINASATECLYVGDNYYDDVIGSQKLGIPSILINPFDRQGIEELPAIPVISNISELLSALDLQNKTKVS